MTVFGKNIFHSRLALAAASTVFYIGCILLLQALAPAGANWGAEKKLIGCCAILFTLTITLLGYSRRAWISCFTFLALYLSIAFLETRVGMKVNGTELIRTAALATILFAAASSTASLQNFLPARFRFLLHLLAAILCLPLLLYPLLFWGYFALDKKLLSVYDTLAIFQTNLEEATEYLQNFHFALPFIFIAALLALLTISFMLVTPPPSRYSSKIALPLLILILIFSTIGFPVAGNCTAGKLIQITCQKLEAYGTYAQKARDRKAKLSKINIQLSQKEPGIYLLIIGESETRDHMSIYGYPHENTPYFTELSTNPNTLIFKNTYSNHVYTIHTLTYALSAKNQYNSIPLEDSFSLIEIAKAAGYKTYWLSNQNPFVAADTPLTSIALSANKQAFIMKSKKGVQLTYDESLADALPDLSKDTHALVIMHLRGCHVKYTERYPKQYQIKTGNNPIVNEYDSAIYHNDFALRHLTDALTKYKHFKGWIYFSDHGEEPDLNYAHTIKHFTWQMTRIPLIMHFTPDFISENPQIFETLATHQDRYWTNDLLYNLILSVLGIEGAPNPEPHLDLASPAYDRAKENVLTLHGEKPISEEP